MMLRKSGLFLLSLAFLANSAFAYDLPPPDANRKPSENVELLQKISAGVSELSQEAGKGVVLISVSKIIKGRPYYEIDPFDFFFGPRFRQPDPGTQDQEQPKQRQQSGVGSGFFVDLDKGYIITNNHVVEDADEIDVKLANGETYQAKVLGKDSNTDVAVVQIKDAKFNRKGLTQLAPGNSDEVHVGDFVIALGAPFGLEFSQSFGAVSAVSRGNLNISSLGNYIQTDAAINPGNSGGPLVDMKGTVIGMNTAIFSRTGAYAGIGFAVPSNLVRDIALQLINKGKVARGYLGLRLSQDLDEELQTALNLPKGTHGALVGKVERGTPAAKGGLESGDVITAVNGKAIASGQELSNTVGLMQPGSKVTVTYFRGGKQRTTEIQLASYGDAPTLAGQDAEDGSGSVEKGSKEFNDAGLKLEALDRRKHAQLIEKFGIESTHGVLVTDLDPQSKIRTSGIRPGDVLLKANNIELKSAKDFMEVYKSSKKILVQLERRGTFLFASIRK